MRSRPVAAACGILLCAALVLAQSRDRSADPISGNWGMNGQTFLELTFDGKSAVTGTAIWRHGQRPAVRTPIKKGTFDPKTLSFRLEGEAATPDGTPANYVIEGVVDQDTVKGTFSVGTNKGDFEFKRL